MKSSSVSAMASSLSAYAEPFLPRCSTVAVPDGAVVSVPAFTTYSSPIQAQASYAIFENYDWGYYGSFDSAVNSVSESLAIPVSASTSGSYPSLNTEPSPPGPSVCSALKNLEILSDQQSSDDSVDSPCYKGRNWSPFPPRHMGETSAPPRVTIEKLEEEQNLSVPVTPVGLLMVSDENADGPTLPVSVRPQEHSLRDVGPARNIPTKKENLPGRREMLQKIVDLSKMLLQIPSNYDDLDEGDKIRLKKILGSLEKLLEKNKKKRNLGENEEN